MKHDTTMAADLDLNEGVTYTAGGIGVRTLDSQGEVQFVPMKIAIQRIRSPSHGCKIKRANSSIASLGIANNAGTFITHGTNVTPCVESQHSCNCCNCPSHNTHITTIPDNQIVSNLKYEPLIS
jgi:hypothetical protein